MPETDSQPACDSPLEACILAGDITGVMDLVDAMSPAERAASLPAVERLVHARWRMLRPQQLDPANPTQALDKHKANRLFRAVDLARFLCTSGHPAADYWMHIGVQDIAAFRQRYQPALSSQPIEKQLRGEHNWHYRRHVHRAIVAGLIERPQTDEYLQALFFGDLRAESNIVLNHVDADPGLAPHLLQLFDHEGTSDGSFAAVEKYCHDPALTWTQAFLTLCERGVYTRTQLLDKTLGALACDWPQFKSGWFSRFHERLAPTVDEMAAFAPRYLALCHSRIAPTVGLAMDALARLYKAGRIDDTQVCEAVQPVVTSAVKDRVLSGLELLGQVVRDTPARAAGISAMAAHALAHTAPDVQKKVIACLQSWGLDAAGQEVARGYLPFVSAVNQAALGKLVGVAQAVAAASTPPAGAGASAPVLPPAPARLSPLDASRALQPLAQVADLVERMAYVLENPADVDEWERVAEALVRLAPIPAADRAAFLALKKRGSRLHWDSKPLGFALAQLMACALGDETAAMASMDSPAGKVSTHDFIAQRTLGLMSQAAAGLGLTPLSAPTHRGGFIDPRQLVARIAACQEANAALPLSEQVFALMRLVPASVDADAARDALQLARSLKDQPVVQALRHALGGTVAVPHDDAAQALFVAAARIRSPRMDDALTLAAFGGLGPDGSAAAQLDWHVSSSEPSEAGYAVFHTLHVTCRPELRPVAPHHYGIALCAKHLMGERWQTETDASTIGFAASLQPSNLEPFFAEGARTLGNNVDWWEAQWQNRAYLDVLLQPTTPMTPMACLLLAVGLAGKEPGQGALAVDALARSVQDGRLDLTAMGQTLARLWATPLVKGPRLAKSLAAATQAHAAMPAAVFALLCAMAEVQSGAPRKDLSPLLELLLELKLTQGLDLPGSTRTALQAMRLSGKGKLAVKALTPVQGAAPGAGEAGPSAPTGEDPALVKP
ncbi:DUF6493 family protein [Polaromonas sp. JS666]|uniref:DUF6493 family protein n=1 Tax=Polaromonas sp. (strain JS666 / ATCC BAA-500) TaxID=296591 RepID=UPI00088D0B1F|nr:DUF6493 family protein [Polaromonas sp. JS666]SDN71693.1 hypothetical protein SAMN05720382_10722 [Polaromonas sp. JS666]